jgi:histidyl-tRNA synthetase
VLRAALEQERASLCDTCLERARTSPLRVFDCKNADCQAVVRRLPRLDGHLCEPCRTHHARVLAGLTALGVPWVENPLLVRGLDYYTRTAFEVHHAPLGAQSALGGGGRYDGLFEACGGPPTPAVGFSAGIERILVALGEEASEMAAPIQVLPVGESARVPALALARTLRRVAPAAVDLSGRSLKAQLRAADRSGARVAVLLGDDEMARGEAMVRDLSRGAQSALALDAVPETVARLLAQPAAPRDATAGEAGS